MEKGLSNFKEQSNPTGEFFTASTYEEFQKIMVDYYERTSSRFICIQKSKEFNISSSKGLDLSGHKIIWDEPTKLHAAPVYQNVNMQFDGVPHIVVGDYLLGCQLGDDQSVSVKKQRSPDNDSLNRRTRRYLPNKCGCPAKIHVKKFIRFPEYKIDPKYEKRKRNVGVMLRKRLDECRESVKCEVVYAGRFPDLQEHRLHQPAIKPKEDKAGVLHKELVYITKELYFNNPSQTITEIKESLNNYVANEMFYNQEVPDPSIRRFYPTKDYVYSVIRRVKLLSVCSKDDENNIYEVMEKMKTKYDNINIHFNVDASDEEQVSEDDVFNADEDGKIKKKKLFSFKAPKRKYLLTVQTPQQQRLLKRYGEVALLVKCDIEDLNIKKSLPFHIYNVMVQTNVDFQTVGCILVSREQKDGLIDGLTIFKSWNTYWRPKYFLVDSWNEIYKAVESIFPDAEYFIDPKSCERKWHEFLKTPSNELNDSYDEVMTFLRDMAFSYTEDSLSITAALFEASEVWKQSTKLKTWFQSTWLDYSKKWIVGYWPEDLLLTNHQNISVRDCLKNYERLLVNCNTDCKAFLAIILETLTDEIPQRDYQCYIDRNKDHYKHCKQFDVPTSKQYCGIPLTIAPYVHNISEFFSDEEFHINRDHLGSFTVKYEKIKAPVSITAEEETKTPRFTSRVTEASCSSCSPALSSPKCPNEKDRYMESKRTGKYFVSFGDSLNHPYCTCADWKMYKLPCVHMLGIFSTIPGWQYNMLSPLYRSSNLFTFDYSCFDSTQSELELDSMDDEIFKNSAEIAATETLLKQCNDLSFHFDKLAFLFRNTTFHKKFSDQLHVLAGQLSTTVELNQILATDESAELVDKPSRENIIFVDHSLTQPLQKSLVEKVKKKLTLTACNLGGKDNKVFKTSSGVRVPSVEVSHIDDFKDVLDSLSKDNPHTKIRIVNDTSEKSTPTKSNQDISKLELILSGLRNDKNDSGNNIANCSQTASPQSISTELITKKVVSAHWKKVETVRLSSMKHVKLMKDKQKQFEEKSILKRKNAASINKMSVLDFLPQLKKINLSASSQTQGIQ